MSAVNPLKDKTAIVGVGWSALSFESGASELELALDAAHMAIADSGLRPADIDGLVTWFWGERDTPAPWQMVAGLGLETCSLALFDSQGGSWACAAVAAAAAAIHAGQCRNVLIYRASNSRSHSIMREGVDIWASGTREWYEPFGGHHMGARLGPLVTAYMDRYGLSNADFAPLAVQHRRHAALNHKAIARRQVSEADHQESPWIVEPFRKLDCCLINDGAMAIVVSSLDAAHHLRHNPVSITACDGGSLAAPYAARTSSAIWEVNGYHAAPRLYRRAGITPQDIDIAQLYDPFTGMCLIHIEAFQLAPAGQAAAMVRAGHFALDGAVPLNTAGGHLAEAAISGLGHIVEAVQQLRDRGVSDDLCQGAHDYDRAHCRQVRDAEFALVCSEAGDSSLILRRHHA